MPTPRFCPPQSSGCSSIPREQLWPHKLRHNLSYLQSSLGYKRCHRDAWHLAVLCLHLEKGRGGHQPYASWDFQQTPHWTPCLMPLPLRSEPAAGR